MLHRLETAGPEALDLRQLQVAQGHLALSRLIDPDGYDLACKHLAELIRNSVAAADPDPAIDSGSGHTTKLD